MSSELWHYKNPQNRSNKYISSDIGASPVAQLSLEIIHQKYIHAYYCIFMEEAVLISLNLIDSHRLHNSTSRSGVNFPLITFDTTPIIQMNSNEYKSHQKVWIIPIIMCHFLTNNTIINHLLNSITMKWMSNLVKIANYFKLYHKMFRFSTRCLCFCLNFCWSICGLYLV